MSQFMSTPKRPNLPPTPMTCKTSLPPLSSLLNNESMVSSPAYSRSSSSATRLPSIDSFTTPINAKVQYHHQTPMTNGVGFSGSGVGLPNGGLAQKSHSAPSLTLATPSKNQNNFTFSNTSIDSSMDDITPSDSLTHSKNNSPIESKAYAFISHSPATFPNQEPSIDNAPLARRKRRRTSANELSILNKEFDLGSTPNKARRIEISLKVHMTEKAVQIWFQNKRQALRKHSTVEKEVTELPQVSEPSMIIASTPVKPILNKAHSFVSPSTHSISPVQKRSHSTTELTKFSEDSNNKLNLNQSVRVKDEENSLVLSETKKKQPNFLNSNNSSTMTFKLAPAKSKSPKREERKALGEINVNTIQNRINAKLELAKKQNESECVQNLLSLRAANWN